MASNNSPMADNTNFDDAPRPKCRKTVHFSQQVEVRHVDADYGAVLWTEIQDLAHGDHDEPATPASDFQLDERPTPTVDRQLDEAARNIDKHLFFLPNMDLDNIPRLLEFPATRPWDDSELQQMLQYYKSSDVAKMTAKISLLFKCRTSSVLFALSRVMKRIEDLEEDRQLEATAQQQRAAG